jgi:hypothetical protein
MSAAGTAPWGLLRRLLLDADGTFVCRRRYERAWIALLALLILLDKLFRFGRWIARAAGAAFLAAGAWLLFFGWV